MTEEQHKRSTALATIVVIAGAGALCWMGATAASRFIERRAMQDVSLALGSNGYDWAEVETSGLQVQLSGTAPDEVQRFRAMTVVGGIVDPSRIVDQIEVASLDAITPPEFSVELLRNDEGISLIGLVPAETDRLNVVRRLQSETAAPQVVDLLESADFPTPDAWTEALDFGMRAAQLAQRAKISVSPGKVKINAVTDSPEDKARLEAALDGSKPNGVTLVSEISAPRPVIAPFTLRFAIGEDGPHFDACSAATEEGRTRIQQAASAAGLNDPEACTLGLGAPSPDWSEAAIQTINTVAALGLGKVTISDADIALSAPASVEREAFDAAIGRLEQNLPPVFSLRAELEQPSDSADQGPTEFIANLSANQTLKMRGRITDERMREAVDSFAGSRFDKVESTLRTDETVPAGWTVRVIAALETLKMLTNGLVTVTPDMVSVTGTSGDRNAALHTTAALAERLGAGAHYEIAVRYDERLDPLLGLPSGEECVARLNTIMSESVIGFEPNKSVIAGDPAETLSLLSDAMTDCTVFRIELGGHTDSQGSEGFNADLSRSRAQAVLAAMTGAGINGANLTSRGYGESQPIASNKTEEGREANRRIEFRLLSAAPIRADQLPAPVVVSGITEEPQPEGETGHDDAEDAAATDSVQLPDGAIPELVLPTGPPIQSPSVVGVTETVAPAGLDEDEENVRLPVQEADENTPRPAPRPETAAE